MSFTLNPQTGRPIKINGRVFQNLVHRRIIEDCEVEDDRVLEGNDEKETIKALNRRLPSNKQAVKGRGKYKGTTVLRNMPRNWGSEESSEGSEEEQ